MAAGSKAPKGSQPDIIRPGITLLDVEPRVTRRMDVPLHTDLDDLQLYTQAATGRDNSHARDFRAVRHDKAINRAGGDHDDMTDKTTPDILAFLKGNRVVTHIHDIGHYWRHRIRIGKGSAGAG